MPVITIIVPTHNSAKYIVECMDSIIAQTLREIEILCIDSSSDETIDILREYARNDNRVKLILDENSSYGHKINVGIQNARGRYIGIVESDDYIDSEMMERLYYEIDKSKADFVKGNFEFFYGEGELRQFSRYERTTVENYGRIIDLTKEPEKRGLVEYNIWSGIYSCNFLADNHILLHESEGAAYQDVGFGILTALCAKSMVLLEDGFYKYRTDNDNSSVKSDKKYAFIPKEFQWLIQKMSQIGCDSIENRIFVYKMQLSSFMWNYDRISEAYKEKFLNYLREDYKEFLGQYINPCLQDQLSKADNIIIVSSGLYASAVNFVLCVADYKEKIYMCDNDKNKQGKFKDGKQIRSVEDCIGLKGNSVYIIANKYWAEEIKKQLYDLNVSEKDVFIWKLEK